MFKLMRRVRRVRPVLPPPSAFTGFRFPREVIVLAVRWYLRYGLSYRDVEELLAERGWQGRVMATDFAVFLRRFLTSHLAGLRGYSTNTIIS
jgi:hypothetical protein